MTPEEVAVQPGATQQFSAEGRSKSGEVLSVSASWQATGGSIDPSGLFTAGSEAGEYRVTAASGDVTGTALVTIETAPVAWPTAGWAVATPQELGLESGKLEQARDYALRGGGAGYITRHGALAMSWGDDATLYPLHSSTKSLAGTALGLALGEHLLQVDDRAYGYLPGIGVPPESNRDTGWLDDITILHLATHTAGFAKPGGFEPIEFEPGTHWQYSDGGTNWLADVLTVRFGQDLDEVLFSRVFTPLGIRAADIIWRSNRYRPQTIEGIERREFGSGLRADVDAMARIGYLYLRRGRWDGQRILPPEFVDLVSRPRDEVQGLPVTSPADYAGASRHYGVLWWTNAGGAIAGVPTDAYWAWGLGDSLVVVIPSLDIVVSRAGEGWRDGWDPDYGVLEPFLRPIADAVAEAGADPQRSDI